jgi:hypothetical protein
MAFDQSTIVAVLPPVYSGFHVMLTWLTTSPPGTWFQIYLDGVLSWWGTTTTATLAVADSHRVDIGAVLPGEEQTDLSAELPAPPARRAQLQWEGGAFESADLAGFYVYGSATAGGPISYSKPLATITYQPAGISTDGFGLGGFGAGGFGTVAGTYTWTSGQLASGSWMFAVVPFDSAGNSGAGVTTSITIAGPPQPPAIDSQGRRLEYTYSPTTFEATLTWLASPG